MSEDDANIELGPVKININDTADGIANYFSFGTVGVNNSGGIEGGPTVRAVGEGLGEITGRNQARKANMDTKQAMVEEKAAKNQEIADERLRAQQQDIASSNQAQSFRATAAAQRNNLLGSSSDASKDFLGL